MSTTYQKIPSLYRFDAQTRRYTSQASTPELEQLWSAPIWLFTEKVDGTNIRVVWDGYRVTFAGRTDNAQIPLHLLEHLHQTFGGPDNERLFEEKFGVPQGPPVVLHGEGFGPKIQKGGANYGAQASFVLFDVRIDDLWLLRPAVEDVAANFAVPVVPLQFDGPVTIDEALDAVRDGLLSRCQHGEHPHLAEGLVGTTALGFLNRRGNRVAVKVKARDLVSPRPARGPGTPPADCATG